MQFNLFKIDYLYSEIPFIKGSFKTYKRKITKCALKIFIRTCVKQGFTWNFWWMGPSTKNIIGPQEAGSLEVMGSRGKAQVGGPGGAN